MRCFLAIELPADTKEILLTAGNAIRRLDPWLAGEKWVAPGALHVTLRFLGELDAGLASRFANDFSERAQGIPRFTLELTGLVAVPKVARASMVWAAVSDPSGRCARLASAAEQISDQFGLDRSARAFKPHVTLVRTRHPRPLGVSTLEDAENESRMDRSESVSVLSATLFSSRLTPHGAIHERLAEMKLADH
jgi:2'-5' RNA ligase